MKWHLDFNIPTYPFVIEHHHKIFTIGSCFAENLSEWLKERYFNVFSNPNGVLFNPISIFININNLLDDPTFFDEKFLFYDNGYWKSLLHQTHFIETEKKELLNKIIEVQITAQKFLKSADYLFVTFGSAFVYEHVELREIVANCHKLPSQMFNKKLLTVDEVVEKYHKLIDKLRNQNPNIKIIFSVSPVKYLSYGLIDNNISKAALILAVHQICKSVKYCYYFPAYELITDDLRDYRFYKEDMAHPNESGIKYVMEKFSDTLLNNKTKEIVMGIEKLLAAKQHKIYTKNIEQIKQFAQKMLEYCIQLEIKYEHLNLNKEKNYFENLYKETLSHL